MKILAAIGISILSLSSLTSKALPLIEFSDGKVIVRDIDREVLYTFSRYFNQYEYWKEIFPVFTKESHGNLTIAGQYHAGETSVTLTPRFPFAAGVVYIAAFDYPALLANPNEVYLPKITCDKVMLEFSPPVASTGAPEVTAVYPSSDKLPENLLKFHICFNNAMTTGHVYEKISLLDAENKLIENAFLVVDDELWDNDMKVLTLMLDPGRIKRGLRANLEMGTPMRAGTTYTLQIEKGWRDVNEKFTSQTFHKTFSVINADRRRPDPEEWTFHLPVSENSSLRIDLNEAYDFISLLSSVRIIDANQNIVIGKFTLSENESVIHFAPETKWKETFYTLQVRAVAEDLAGNNFNRRFDEETEKRVIPHVDSYSRRFVVSFAKTAR